MTVSKLPNGRWRARVWKGDREVAVAKVLGLASGRTWRTKREANYAHAKAQLLVKDHGRSEMTLQQFWHRWTTDPLFARPKEATNLHNRERTEAFVEHYGKLLLSDLGDHVVAEWLAGGKRNGTVPALRAMFNDAASAKAGRLIQVNPFANLGIGRTKGNRTKQPPSQEQMEKMVVIARQLTPPSFSAYLEFACCTAARPSELDALRWNCVRFEDDEVDLIEQWNAKTRTFSAPKCGAYTVALVARARQVLLTMKRDSDSPFVFTTLRGTHYTPTSRTHHWNRVRCAAGMPDTTLYLATRHYFGWYALSVLELEPHIIAEQLGHKDGGKLVIQLYGHPDKQRARRRIREAFDRAAEVTPLRVINGETS
jgi:integrase